MGSPDILLPKAIGNFISLFLKFLSEIISLKKTFSLDIFGNSIPTVLLPGIVAILADSELVFLAMTIPDYEVMAYNMQELKRYITELKDVVVYYREVTTADLNNGENNTKQ